MNTFQKDFVGIIISAFSNKKHRISVGFNWDEAISVAIKHNIVAIFYYGALNCGVSADDTYMKKLFFLTCQSITISQRQMSEVSKLEKVFDESNVEYMPLKGVILKSLYPKPEMRTMGDADILIKVEQYEKIKALVKELGYKFSHESDHELIWKKPSLYLELHKSVMTSYNKDFYWYFNTGWNFAKKEKNSSKYLMSPEDFYIYLFVHFVKHYRISGIGIKHLLDLWVVSCAYPDMDNDYILNMLSKLNLTDFYKNVVNTIDVWFYQKESNEKTNLITNVIFNSGQYGTADMAIVNRAIRDENGPFWKMRLTKMFKRTFLSYTDMSQKYAFLKKTPLLLPVMWVIRWFEIILFRRNAIKKQVEDIKLIKSEKLDEHIKALKFVGIDFNKK